MYVLRIVTTVFIALTMFSEIMSMKEPKYRFVIGFAILINILSLVCMWGIYE